MPTRTVRPIAYSSLFFLIACMLAALIVLVPQRVFAQDGPPAEVESANLYVASTTTPGFTPGVVLVGVRGEVVAASVPDWGGIEVLAVEPLDVRGGEVSAAGEAMPLVGYKLTVPEGTELDAVASLLARSDVVFAEPDWLVQIAQIAPLVSEPQMSEPDVAVNETPFVVTDTLYRAQWYMQRIGMSRAWALALAEAGGSLASIEIVVIDTGADFSHPDLAPILASGRNYVNSLLTPHDDNGHGTHVSGLAAAALNGTGTAGPALNVRIVPYKALNANGTGGVNTIGQAIRDAADSGAEIINMSLEIAIDTFALRSATQYAVSQGVLVIAASGNHNQPNVAYPAAYPGVLAVGASTYDDERASYSNQGVDLDLVAPGGGDGFSMLSTWTRDVGALCPAGLRQVDGGLYCQTDGTSMASGVVSGVAALILSLRPDLDADEVQDILRDSAFPLAEPSDEVGSGRLDAAKAVRMAVRPRLVYDAQLVQPVAVEGDAAFVVNLPFTNPSLEPVSVTMTPTMTTTWYALVGPRTGNVSYGDPLDVQLVFTPTAVPTGTVQSTIRLTTTVAGGGTSVYFITPRLQVLPSLVGDARLYVPWTTNVPGAFHWEEPGFSGRISYPIGDNGTILVDLPFTMTVYDQSYTDLRIYADGFVIAPADTFVASGPNVCLDNQTSPDFAAYGWWSDLSLAVDSRLSTFQPDADRFVIEYDSFVSMNSFDPDDRVTFQIILDRSGQIEYKYREVPEHTPADLTVGASIEDGRFFNQVTCYMDGIIELGEVPQANQSFDFLTGELY